MIAVKKMPESQMCQIQLKDIEHGHSSALE